MVFILFNTKPEWVEKLLTTQTHKEIIKKSVKKIMRYTLERFDFDVKIVAKRKMVGVCYDHVRANNRQPHTYV